MTTIRARRRRGTGHERRAVLIQAATDLLARHGDVDALTMRDVASAAGVTPPSVYRHFPDKQALVRAVIIERFDEFTGMLQASAAAAGEIPIPRLQATARAYVRWGLEQPGHYRFCSVPPTRDRPVWVCPAERASWRRFPPRAGGGGRRVLPPRRRAAALALATQLWASLHGIVDLRITKPELSWPDPDTLVDMALAAVRAACNPLR